MALQIGDYAPNFTLTADTGETVSLSQLHGKKIILYFYPKDNTPGCTREACDFRDAQTHFAAKNTIIIGVSKDSVDKHKKFKEKYQLPFTLLADTTGEVCEAYGAINKKSLFGRTFLGIQRMTFLIDEKGLIQAIWPRVNVKGHSEQVIHEISKN